MVFFDGLAGYPFVVGHRRNLARWFEQYSPEFLRLAHRLGPSLTPSKGLYAFVDLLNQDFRRPWPAALQAQYQRDLKPILEAATPAPLRIQVRPGDVLRWPDGRTATVERVDSADAVTDAPDDERGYVPLSLIGRSVQVMRA